MMLNDTQVLRTKSYFLGKMSFIPISWNYKCDATALLDGILHSYLENTKPWIHKTWNFILKFIIMMCLVMDDFKTLLYVVINRGSREYHIRCNQRSRHVKKWIAIKGIFEFPCASFNMILTNFKIYDLGVDDLESMALRLGVND